MKNTEDDKKVQDIDIIVTQARELNKQCRRMDGLKRDIKKLQEKLQFYNTTKFETLEKEIKERDRTIKRLKKKIEIDNQIIKNLIKKEGGNDE